jgi:hypothetical protein
VTIAETAHDPNLTQSHDPMRTATDVARYLLAGAAACYLVIYVVLACIRLGYPYELEWLEGACVDHVRWILSGRPLYVEPSVDFTPFCYTPLYFYVSAGLARIMGAGFLPLRLVSLLASLGVFALLLAFVRRQTGSTMWGLIAAGLYAATYRASGAWFDIARVDSLFMFLLLAGVYAVRFREGFWGLLMAGVLMSLAFLTKQTALLVALPLMAYAFLAKPRRSAWAFAGSYVLLLVITTIVLNVATGGWYVYYVFGLPAYHDKLPAMLTAFWTVDLAKPMGIAMALAMVCVVSRLSEDIRKQFAFFAALLAGMVAAAWLGRFHGAGYDNVLQPAYAFLAIGMAVGAQTLESSWLGLTDSAAAPVPAPPDGGAGRFATSLLLSLYCVGLIQFALLCYSPSAQIPSKQDALAGDRLVATVSHIDGDVWIPYHGFLAAMAGHSGFHCHAMAVNDVLRGPDGEPRSKLLSDMTSAIASRRFAAILLDDEWQFKTTAWQPLMRALAESYNPPEIIVADKTTFLPVTGDKNRPTMLLTVRESLHGQAQPASTQP